MLEADYALIPQEEAGFRTIETRELAHDIQNNWYGVHK
jgi:hypothetical protein